jgi:hypothetical protein
MLGSAEFAQAARSVVRVESGLGLPTEFLWIVGWYLVWRITRLRFLWSVIIGDSLYLAYSLFVRTPQAFGWLSTAPGVVLASVVLHFAGAALNFIAAIIGVRYLLSRADVRSAIRPSVEDESD